MRELWSYIAGLLEVGGWIGVRGAGPALSVTAPKDVCTKLVRRTGAGSAYRGKTPGSMWTWQVQDAEQATFVLQSILPFMSQTRQDEVRRAIGGIQP